MHKIEHKEIIGISALLIHAAKIDEIYSEQEKKIISNFIKNNIDNKNSVESAMKEAEKDGRRLKSIIKFYKNY